MKEPDQHTDSLFKNLERMEVQPSEKVWANIESRLERKKKRLIPIFLGWGAAASVLLLAGLFLLFPDDSVNDRNRSVATNMPADHGVVDSSEELTLDGKEQNKEAIQALPENIEIAEEDFIANAETDVQMVESSGLLALPAVVETENRVVSKLSGERNSESLHKINSLSEVRLSSGSVRTKITLLAKKQEEQKYPLFSLPEEPKSEKSQVGVILGGEYSPTYAYRDVSGASASGMNESGLMTSGGGFNVAVKMNSRWQIETGVKYAMLGQEVKPEQAASKVYAAPGFSAESSVSLKEVQLTNSMGTIERDASPALNSDARDFQSTYNTVVEMKAAAPNFEQSTVLEQNLSYLQVPFTLRYQLLRQGSIQLSLAGGIGANWLVDNNAYLEMSGQRQRIGQTGGVSGLSFSTHAGVAVSVPVYRGLGIKMEPRINYFLSDITDDGPGKFRPYSIGVFTGLFYQW